MGIMVYSTEARRKTELSLIRPGQVSMYVCGPTVYDACHIGHARPAVVFDVIRRYLEYTGLIVTFISNVTDIDDKIIARSGELGVPWRFLARRYQDEYERDMAALGVRSPTIRPRATEHIDDMIRLVSGLIGKGNAYVGENGVWFDVSTFRDYGRLSGRSRDGENTEHRVEPGAEKRNPQDFSLWKAAKPGEPSWDSPWGPGRPGWHIECSAMSGKYCDFQLDIHGGGADLAFPHHENELAQSEAYTGRRFVRHWLHNGFITVGKEEGDDVEKMGKSRGNAFLLDDAFRLASPAALRLWILGTHYRTPLLYRPEFPPQAENALDRFHTCLEESARAIGNTPDVRPEDGGDIETEHRFREAMDDDFNTPQALAVVHEAVGRLNSAVQNHVPADRIKRDRNTLLDLLGVLGLPAERRAAGGGDGSAFIDLLVEIRTEARKAKNFPLSDRIRDGLGKLGVEVNDRGSGSTWIKK